MIHQIGTERKKGTQKMVLIKRNVVIYTRNEETVDGIHHSKALRWLILFVAQQRRTLHVYHRFFVGALLGLSLHRVWWLRIEIEFNCIDRKHV